MGFIKSKDVRSKHRKRNSPDSSNPPTGCPSGYLFYDTICQNGLSFSGCSQIDPCDEPNLGSAATQTVYYLTAAPTSSAATPSTQTTRKTSSAQTKEPASISANNLRSSSNLSLSSSQTSPRAFLISAQTTTPSIPGQIETPTTAISSGSVGTSRSSSPSHPNTAAVAAGTVGAIAGAILALILIMLLLRRRKRRTEDNVQATQHEKDMPLRESDANGAGSSGQDTNSSGMSPSFPTKLFQQRGCKRDLSNRIIALPLATRDFRSNDLQ